MSATPPDIMCMLLQNLRAPVGGDEFLVIAAHVRRDTEEPFNVSVRPCRTPSRPAKAATVFLPAKYAMAADILKAIDTEGATTLRKSASNCIWD